MKNEKKIYTSLIIITFLIALFTNEHILKYFTVDGEINELNIVIILNILSYFFFSLFIILLFLFIRNFELEKFLKKKKREITLVILSVFLTLVFLEFFLQNYNPNKLVNKTIESVHHEFSVKFKYNNFGFRDENFIKNSSKDKIFFIGDSFVFGSAVNQQFTFDKIVEEKIYKSNLEKINIYNLGIPGGNISNYYYTLKKFKDFDPKSIFVFIYVDNDIKGDFDTKHFFSVLNNFLNKSSLLNIIKKLFQNPEEYYFSDEHLNKFNLSEKYRNLFKLQRINYHLLSLKFRGNFHDYYKSLVQIFKNSKQDKEKIIQMKKIAAEINSDFHLVLIPSKYQVKKKYMELPAKEFGFEFNMNEVINDEIQNEIIFWAKKNKIQVIDLLKFLLKNKNENYHIIDDHFNTKGNQLAGEILFDIIYDNYK